jgi:very-short-patch-repair endonuclease
MQNPKVRNVKNRILLALLFAGVVMYFPLLLFVSAFIIWSLISDTMAVGRERELINNDANPRKRSISITSEDPNWKSYFESVCESPAETAFLEAMISDFGLVLDKNTLRGGGLTLDLQVELPPYRVDFLVDRRLIVEIDGAAYHSSPEAISRDRARDQALEGRGFTILRIPAKVVFARPNEAVRRVREADAACKLAEQTKVETRKDDILPDQGFFEMVNEFIDKTHDTVHELNKSINFRSQLQDALSKPRLVFFNEKYAIETSMKSAEFDIKIDSWKSEKEGRAERFQETYDRPQ